MSLFTSALNAFSGDKAAKTQERAARAAGDTIWKQYEQTRADLSPYRDSGSSALSRYRDALGFGGQDAAKTAWAGYTQSPFLPGMIRDTVDAVDHSRAARGGLFSGGTATEVGDRTGQLYLRDANSWLERLRGLAEGGQSAAAQTGQFGANAAQGKADSINAVGGYKAQQAIMPAMGWQQFMNDIKGTAGAFAGGAFGR